MVLETAERALQSRKSLLDKASITGASLCRAKYVSAGE